MFITIVFLVILALGPLFLLILGGRIIRLLQSIIPTAMEIEELEVRIRLLEQHSKHEDPDHA